MPAGIRLHRDWEDAPTGKIETGRSLLPGKRNRSGYHETVFTTTSYETPSMYVPAEGEH